QVAKRPSGARWPGAGEPDTQSRSPICERSEQGRGLGESGGEAPVQRHAGGGADVGEGAFASVASRAIGDVGGGARGAKRSAATPLGAPQGSDGTAEVDSRGPYF